MDRLRFLAIAVVAIGWSCAVWSQPNVIFILADDLGVGDLGAYGQQTVQTPSLDRMASEGMTFTRMYSGAPTCSPSRATLMTGLHNGRHNNGNGVSLPAGTATTAQVLREAGYNTGMFGKVHLGGANSLWGFNEFYGIRDGVAAWDHFRPIMDVGTADATGRISSITTESTGGAYTDDLIAQRAGDWVAANAAAGDPFYAQVSFQIPHFDLEVPELEPYTANQPWAEERKVFASMVTRMDRRIGELLDRLDDPNGDGDTADSIADNTLVVFASDNGTHIEGSEPTLGRGPHDPAFFDSNGIYRGWKRDLYDGGIHTPFLARWAGTITPGSTSTHYGDFSDFLPTAAELAGADAPIQIDGESYAHVLTGSSPTLPAVREDLYFEFTGGWFTNGANGDFVSGSTPVPPRHALVRDGYKAIRFSDGTTELYDLTTDPGETTNLANQLPTLASQMIAAAQAQDLGQLRYLSSSPGGDYFDQSSSWGGQPIPDSRTVVTLADDGPNQTKHVSVSTTAFAVDIGQGDAVSQLIVGPSVNLGATNGVRAAANGVLRLESGAIFTDRRIEARGGQIAGTGLLLGQTVNDGQIAPDGDTTTPPPRTEPTAALRFNFSGVQDDAPLLATSVLDPNLQLVEGFDFGPGTQPRSAGPDGFTGSDRGNEFNVGGFNTTSLASAIASEDYLAYTVQAAAGFELLVDNVQFRLWRNGGNAANDYAILTSLDGFVAGQDLAQLNNVFDSGAASERTFRGDYIGSVATSDPVEVRLYAWNANDFLASTHITDVTMEATVQLSGSANIGSGNLASSGVSSPYGTLAVGGDYVQTSSGELLIDVGGREAGVDQDLLSITDRALLDGTLIVHVDPSMAIESGDRFHLLLAADVVGAFGDVVLPQAPGGLRFALEYHSDSVALAVVGVRGDYDGNGVVEPADYLVWQDAFGTIGAGLQADGNADGVVDIADYTVWRDNLGAVAATSLLDNRVSVPETSALGLLTLCVLSLVFRAERGHAG